MEEKRVMLTNYFIARLAISRYVQKKMDTFVIIYGRPRTGKTTLGFNFFIPYLKLCRRAHNKGYIEFNPERSWKQIFRNYFALSADDMIKKVKRNPRCSPVFIDESLDFLSWHDALSKEQQDLVELLMKTGEKGMFTILITPSLSLLTKDILSRAHYMFLIPNEFNGSKNRAIVLRNYDNPILAEKNPFGVFSLIKKVEKHPRFFSDIGNFISLAQTQKTFKGWITFRFIKKSIYDLYVKMVKEPLIMQEKRRKRFVSKASFEKLKYMFQTILYNLHEKDGKSLAQIETLLTDKFGKVLLSRQTIAKYIEIIKMLEVQPDLEDVSETVEEEIEKRMKKEEIEDIPFDLESADEILDSTDAGEESDEKEDEVD
ncbi:MAG: hypothetical protein DRP47_09355 [Candidatus Zixiibacteriota bacterium]|nr:MAG: hypothetical protein DRP47_09355 [candidate division Zixibacteria bacterium]